MVRGRKDANLNAEGINWSRFYDLLLNYIQPSYRCESFTVKPFLFSLF